jgi:phosphatidylinositol alpha-1,6-mannosyltransferase
MMILASVISSMGEGGVQMVNRLILQAAAGAQLPGTVVSLHDGGRPPTLAPWPDAFCAGGSRLRFAGGALARRRHARGSVVLATHIGLASVGRIVKRAAAARLCLFLHGVESWRRESPLREWGLAGVDRLVANSRFTLDRFREAHPRMAAIPGEVCHLPARRLATGHPALTERRTGPRVLVVGRLWGRGLRKGQSQLISVWPEVRREFPDAELWIVGEGEGRSALETTAQASTAGHSIRFTGAVADDELESLYSRCDVYAMPSEGEGFGLVFAEAMAHGLPCIASRHDAGAEVVSDGETGLLVDPRSPDEILGALRRLLGDAALRARMGAAARLRTEALFSIDGFNQRVTTLLQTGTVGR